MLQLVLHLRPHLHPLLPVTQQLTHIAHLHARHPYPWKSSVAQQGQNMLRVALVRLLLPHHQPPDLRRIPQPQLVAHLRQHLLEPLRVAHRFHPHAHRLPAECFVEATRFPLLVPQASFARFARFHIDHRELLIAGMKIASYNLHRGSSPPSAWSSQTQVYSLVLGAAFRHSIKRARSATRDLLQNAFRGCFKHFVIATHTPALPPFPPGAPPAVGRHPEERSDEGSLPGFSPLIGRRVSEDSCISVRVHEP